VARVFVSWSGGKDGCLAAYRAVRSGLEIGCLANTVSADGSRSVSHGMAASVIRRQAAAMGLTVYQQPTGENDYREKFLEMLAVFKADGITGGVFGDIDFNPHREWIDSVCAAAGMTAYLPLWQEDQTGLLHEFIDAGFVSIVVAVRQDVLGPEFLGRTVDRSFLADLAALGRGITPCGEAGEYHSLVVDGPLFWQRLELTQTRTVTRDDHHFLDITGTALRPREPARE
jgi:diphthine-ammonia ligase